MASVVDVLGVAPQIGILAAIIAGVRMVVWLVGLMIVLRGCPPEHRSKVLRAYGASLPRFALRARSDAEDDDGSLRSGSTDGGHGWPTSRSRWHRS